MHAFARSRRATSALVCLVASLVASAPADARLAHNLHVASSASGPTAPPTNADVTAFAALPMSFEPNVGQCDGPAEYLARGRDYSVFLTRDSVVLGVGRSGDALRMRLVGANPAARISPERALPGVSNYLVGPDPDAWHRDVPTCAAVRYSGVYEGIDMYCYGSGHRLEYDLEVAPGADPGRIRVQFVGQRSAAVNDDGDLVLALADGEIRQQRALVYQTDAAGKRPVAARYVVGADGEVGLTVGEYDATRPLVVDPVLVFDRYLGGGRSRETSVDVAVDASGNVYILGTTDASNFPTSAGAYDTALSFESVELPIGDVFLTKTNATGSAILYSTYLGGGGIDMPSALALDGAGDAYVVGGTASYDFPTTPGAFDVTPSIGDAFITEINPTGTALVYSTVLGSASGPSFDIATATGVAVDSAGRATVVGTVKGPGFATTSSALDTTFNGGNTDAFVTRLNAGGATLAYSTYLGGEGEDEADAVGLDAAGDAFVTGSTTSTNFPATAGSTARGDTDAFLTKISPDGSALVTSSYLGGSGYEIGRAVVVDGTGAAYVAGWTGSLNFPVSPGAYHTAAAASTSVFVTKVNAAGTTIVYSARFGGSDAEQVSDLGVDAQGSAYVVGVTHSADFPTTAFSADTSYNGSADAFVVKLNAAGGGLGYSTFVGGSLDEATGGLALTASNEAVTVGSTESYDFPTTAGALRTRAAGGGDAFVTKVSTDGRSFAFSTYLSGTASPFPVAGDEVDGVAVDTAGNVFVAGSTQSPNFPTTPGAFDTTPVAPDPGGDNNVFVAKLSADGSTLLYSTFLGGRAADLASSIAVDASGSAYVGGATSSPDFPTTAGAFDRTYADSQPQLFGEGFVTKLAPSGGALVYSTYLGGDASEAVRDVALGANGVLYAAGSTSSTNFPTTPGAFDRSENGNDDAFVAEVAGDGGSLVYSTFLGGLHNDGCTAVAVDPSGAAYVTGYTLSAGFPTTPGAFDTVFGGEENEGHDAFVAKLAPNGASLVYSSFLGGANGSDAGNAVALDASGAAYVVGVTAADDFPATPGAFDTTLDDTSNDGFLAKVAPDGRSLAYSTYLGGSSLDYANAVAVDASGEAIVTGTTLSPDFPTTPGAFDTAIGSGAGSEGFDAFTMFVSSSGSSLVYSTFLGGAGSDSGVAEAVDANGTVYVAGATSSFDWAQDGFGDRDSANAYVAKLDLPADFRGDTPGIYLPSTGAWFLRNSSSPGVADNAFGYGPANGGFVPLAGDWNGDGVDTPGLYAPSTGTFFLKNSSGPGNADLAFAYGPAGAGVVPLAGDWDGDGTDTIGIYVPSTGTFFLRNSSSPGSADLAFQFGGGGAGITPLTGDWNGDGTDTVGLYQSATGVFFLRDSNTPGVADTTFSFGPPNLAPVVGDWNGDGKDTIGVYVSASGTWFLKNANASGVADRAFAYGPPGAKPITGDWNGQ